MEKSRVTILFVSAMLLTMGLHRLGLISMNVRDGLTITAVVLGLVLSNRRFPGKPASADPSR